jgi:hypothetical protein
MKIKGFNEILILMKLHIRHSEIQFAKVTIAGVLDLPVLVLFSLVTRVTSSSGNPVQGRGQRTRWMDRQQAP